MALKRIRPFAPPSTFGVKTVKKPSVGVGWGWGTKILQLYELATVEKFEQTQQWQGLTKNYFERIAKVQISLTNLVESVT